MAYVLTFYKLFIEIKKKRKNTEIGRGDQEDRGRCVIFFESC